MENTQHRQNNYLFLSKKDMGIISALFAVAFIASFTFLWTNSIFIERLNLTMQILSVILFILLGMNVSFFVYNLISKPEKLIPKLLHLQNNGVLQKTVSELLVLNMLSLVNFVFLATSYMFDLQHMQNLQIVIVSLSVASWPIFFLILMNIDVSLYSSETTYCRKAEFGGMAVAENCGPAVVPSEAKSELVK